MYSLVLVKDANWRLFPSVLLSSHDCEGPKFSIARLLFTLSYHICNAVQSLNMHTFLRFYFTVFPMTNIQQAGELFLHLSIIQKLTYCLIFSSWRQYLIEVLGKETYEYIFSKYCVICSELILLPWVFAICKRKNYFKKILQVEKICMKKLFYKAYCSSTNFSVSLNAAHVRWSSG